MYDSWSLNVTRDADSLPKEYFEWMINKLYFSIPLTSDPDSHIYYNEVKSDFTQLEEQLKGLYFTYWDH